MEFDFSNTYLYKMHALTTSLDALFDKELRRHAGIGLSQFTLLLAVQHGQPVTQRATAGFLMISPGAVSRQVDIASRNGWLRTTSGTDRRSQHLVLSPAGEDMIRAGIAALERQAFAVFDDENHQGNLMEHIDLLQRNVSRTNDC